MDSWNGKFSYQLKEHWEDFGHTVLMNPEWDDTLDSDIIFYYQSDNCLVQGSEMGLKHKGKVFAQCVDIEVWAGQPFAVNWNYVDGCFFMAEHIKEYVTQRINFKFDTPVIKPGIDLKKYSLSTPKPLESRPLRKIAYLVGNRRIWDVKRLDIALQMLYDLHKATDKLWQLYIRGTYSSHEQYNRYCKHLEKSLGLKDFIFWYPDRIEDINQWLEDKDFLFLPSTKEAFSYATAEAMAKGIKPVLNNWEGARDTWGKYICNSYGEMFDKFVEDEYKPEEYRKYIEDNYNQDRYFKEVDDYLGIRRGVNKMDNEIDKQKKPLTSPPPPPPTPVSEPSKSEPSKAETSTEFKGTPVRATGDKVFILKGGMKYWVSTPEAYERMGFKFGDEVKVDDETLAVIPEGDPLI